MRSAQQRLMEPLTRTQLDAEPEDLWSCHIAILFNDESCKPNAIGTVRNRVPMDDIAEINPNYIRYERSAGVLQGCFGKLRSHYTIANPRFQQSGQGDCQAFPNFALRRTITMYVHCFTGAFPGMEEFSCRLSTPNSQRQVGVGKQL